MTPWTPLFMGFSRQEYWSGFPFPSPRDLPDPGIKPRCPALQANSLLSELPREADGLGGKNEATEIRSNVMEVFVNFVTYYTIFL